MSTKKRPLLPLSEARRPFYAGVDLGGTNIKAAIVDDDGRMVAFHTEPTHADRGPEDTAARMGRMVHTLAGMVGIAASDIARVGLGTPGPQDLATGVILRAGNLPGWDNFPIRDRVAVHCGHEVTYANDATAAAYGEFWVGSAKRLRQPRCCSHSARAWAAGSSSATHRSTAPTAMPRSLATSSSIRRPRRGSAPAVTAAISRPTASATVAQSTCPRRDSPEHGPSSLSKAVAAGEELTPILISREAAAGDPLASGPDHGNRPLAGDRHRDAHAHDRSGGRADRRGDDLRR
jgi:hypothetical protein